MKKLTTAEILRLHHIQGVLQQIHKTKISTLDKYFPSWREKQAKLEAEIPVYFTVTRKMFSFEWDKAERKFTREYREYTPVDFYKKDGTYVNTNWILKASIIDYVQNYICIPCEDSEKAEAIWEDMQTEAEYEDLKETEDSLIAWLHSGI